MDDKSYKSWDQVSYSFSITKIAHAYIKQGPTTFKVWCVLY